jgi:F0F1-type ATP synthase membrane subunit c/vacuolar-type H+-ATPase subunit K
MNGLLTALAALIPSIGVGLLFWYAMRAVVNADRTEREALARMEAAERAAHGPDSPKDARPNV